MKVHVCKYLRNDSIMHMCGGYNIAISLFVCVCLYVFSHIFCKLGLLQKKHGYVGKYHIGAQYSKVSKNRAFYGVMDTFIALDTLSYFPCSSYLSKCLNLCVRMLV